MRYYVMANQLSEKMNHDFEIKAFPLNLDRDNVIISSVNGGLRK